MYKRKEKGGGASGYADGSAYGPSSGYGASRRQSKASQYTNSSGDFGSPPASARAGRGRRGPGQGPDGPGPGPNERRKRVASAGGGFSSDYAEQSHGYQPGPDDKDERY